MVCSQVKRQEQWVLLSVVSGWMLVCASCVNHVIHSHAVKHQNVAIRYLEDGKCIKAEERFRLALEYGDQFAHPHNGLGMVALLCRSDLDQAAQHFKDALAIDDDFAEAHNNLGTTFFRRSPSQYREACERFEAAIEINPAYLDARENLGMCLVRWGVEQGEKGNTAARKRHFRKARSHLLRLRELSPTNTNAEHHLGFMHLSMERYEAAERHFQRCLEIDTDKSACAYNLGYVYLLSGRCWDAIRLFFSVLRDPQAVDTAVGAGRNVRVAYELCAAKDHVIQLFLDRIRLAFEDPGLHDELGKLYLERGLNRQAIQEWKNALALDPRYCQGHYQLAKEANHRRDLVTARRHCRDFATCTGSTASGLKYLRWCKFKHQLSAP
ncbi:MAG: tetratricopeptide repeat protein [Myxococcales bacterium]|nr:tetratricopeptide repeat protein [Myxococcales bacterium]